MIRLYCVMAQRDWLCWEIYYPIIQLAFIKKSRHKPAYMMDKYCFIRLFVL